MRTTDGGQGWTQRDDFPRTFFWAELLKLVFLVDVLRCPRCGGRRKILAAITEGRVIRAILTSLRLPTEPPVVHPARGPHDELLWE
jgi:hypothetical protein